ncbi:MAG: carbohydrate porin, partial [Leclercia adecarboxylata]|nr:carbohydrate porin [Leclercia adecarboxylata]
VFATYAKWDEKWGYANNGDTNAGYTSGVAYNDTSARTFSRGDNDEWTFGAQMEIWW